MTDNPDGKAQVTQSAAGLAAIVLVVNIFVALAQFADGFSWAAMFFASVGNVIANLVLLAIGVALVPNVRRLAQGASVTLYIWVAIVLPVLMVPCQRFVPYALHELWKIALSTRQ
jgi:hypothetical protein